MYEYVRDYPARAKLLAKAKRKLLLISDKKNIKECFSKLVEQREDLEAIGLPAQIRPKPKACFVTSGNKDSKEPVVGLSPGSQRPSEPKSKPRPRLRRNDKPLGRPISRPRLKRRRAPSAKTLRYLGLYKDFSVPYLETSEMDACTLAEISLGYNIGPAQSTILPESLIKTFPDDSRLETIKLAKTHEGIKNRKYRRSKFDKVFYQCNGRFSDKDKVNLNPSKTLVVVVRVHWPCLPRPQWQRRQDCPKLSQVIVMLGSQTLDHLRDKIKCVTDSAVAEECSDNPCKKRAHTNKDVYKSGFFFINKEFFNDLRHPENIDYSQVIRTWGIQKNFNLTNNTYRMESMTMEDLTVQLGQYYIYQHQGTCEHVVTISDIRLLSNSEPRSSLKYPYVLYEACPKVKMCYMCGRYHAKWLTMNSIRVPYNPSYFCERCFYSYNYVDDKKVGEFNAYNFKEPIYVT